METITREALKRRIDGNGHGEGVKLVEVLDPEAFEHFHLPGAVNIPFDDRFDERVRSEIPNKNREVVLYSLDESSDVSPRAAERMEALGYQHVYDYTKGKLDWKQAGLPIES